MTGNTAPSAQNCPIASWQKEEKENKEKGKDNKKKKKKVMKGRSLELTDVLFSN